MIRIESLVPEAAKRRTQQRMARPERGGSRIPQEARPRPRIRRGVEEREEKGEMQAAAIDQFGPPEVLTPHTVPVPEIGTREVLIEVHAAGVGIWDADIRGGWWPKGKPKFPLTLGTDGAGIIVAKGPRVRRFAVGDRVWASELINPKGGFYAEYVAIHSDHVGSVPKYLDLQQAGAAAVTGLTALQGIDEKLRLQKDQTVLIFGASGAVGTLAVQFAKRRQARVIAAASGRDGIALVRKLGADEALDGHAKGFLEKLRALVPDGLDAVLALDGGEVLDQALELVRAGGRVAFPNGVEPEPQRTGLIRLIRYDAMMSPKHFARLETAVGEIRLQVPIAASFPLDQAAKAHERIEQGHTLGRVVLRVRR